ncbi:hypothetical protein GCM10011611_67350 [Aliidongia dinghuensis]|uniref:General secretion pathway protein GspN n=1 Tax=Aliidongia dinghuensis TaxID=1867774 RepID=A0A8J3E5Y8_9PROT|nr:hypothetical protein [Aliidongia dinghuensis]GGF51404.1 hypothetical protein GCM10011611_67350 [Aliidongia dinghuensis]
MSPTRTQLALGSVSAAMLVAIAALEGLPQAPVLPTATSGDERILTSPMPANTDEPVSALAALRSRPPFWQDRHVPTLVAAPAPPMPVPVAPPPPPPPDPKTELTLVGIVHGPDARIAIVRVKATGKVERRVEGDAIDQWTVARILADRIVLLRGGSEGELTPPPPGERKAGASVPSNPQHTLMSPPLVMPPPPARR